MKFQKNSPLINGQGWVQTRRALAITRERQRLAADYHMMQARNWRWWKGGVKNRGYRLAMPKTKVLLLKSLYS